MHHWLAVVAIVTVLFVLNGPASTSERIGVAATAKNKVVGTHAGRSRNLRAGNDVHHREAVATGTRSSTQLQFRDKTNLTLGQKSRVVLDRFIYKPRRSTSDALLNVTKGSFRFISGTAERKKFRLKVPGAHIGTRG